MKIYRLMRLHDVSGVSGAGVVAYAVEFPNGKVAVAWHAEGRPKSVAVYDSMDEAWLVHTHGGASQFQLIEYLDHPETMSHLLPWGKDESV